MRGWVYIMTNKAMPGLVKVGYSMKDPELRAGELNHTGVPFPYMVDYEMLIDEPRDIEQETHKRLSPFSAKSEMKLTASGTGKEWFQCSVQEAATAIQQVSNGRAILENFKEGNGVLENSVEAVKRFRIVAEQGNANAQLNLGYMYSTGGGVPQDYAEAVKWFRKSAEQGDVDAYKALFVMYSKGEGVPQDYAEALKWVRKFAEQGYAQAQALLGVKYLEGKDVPRDYVEGVKWLKKSAEQGYARAVHDLGGIYYYGYGAPVDYIEAAKWYRKSVELGNLRAQNSLGYMYSKGEGVPQDYVEALKWYRKSAEEGDCDAQYELGIMYDQGHGVPQDYVEAYKWYILAISSAFPLDEDTSNPHHFYKVETRSELATKMTPEQLEEAKRRAIGWYTKSAEQVCGREAHLAQIYSMGQAVPQDYVEAAKLYRKAAEQGYDDAQKYLGDMYYKGQGVPQDYVEAYKWFNLASPDSSSKDDSDKAAEYRDNIAAKMTPEQIAEAQKRAREWRPTK